MERLSPAICSVVILLMVLMSWTTGEPQYQFPYPGPIFAEAARGKPIGIYERSGGGSIFAASVNNSKIGLYGKQGVVSVDSPCAPVHGKFPISRSGRVSSYLEAPVYAPFPPSRGPLITQRTKLPDPRMLPRRTASRFPPLPPKYLIPFAQYSRVQSGK